MANTPEQEAEIQERSEAVFSAFERQDFAEAVTQFTESVHDWTRHGNAEAAAELAERVEVYRDKLPEELVNRFDVKLGEALFRTGTAENGSLERAQEAYQRVADAEVPELPKEGVELTEEEERQYSEKFHALDRLADVALANGQFAEAEQRYAEANDTRGPEDGRFAQPGPRACALYGEAAAIFAQGDTDDRQGTEACEAKIEEALRILQGKEGEETELLTNIHNLEIAAGTLDQLDTNEREQVIKRVQESIVASGGASGGVKHMNFREIVEVAVVEVREGQS